MPVFEEQAVPKNEVWVVGDIHLPTADKEWLEEARRRLAKVINVSDLVLVGDQLGLPPRPIRSPNART